MFPGGMGNMQAMMKKVQKMQADMAKMQEDLKSRTVETSVGGGAVTVVVSGKKELKSIKINPTAVDPEDVEMLEDMILTAVNDAMKQIDELTEKEKLVVSLYYYDELTMKEISLIMHLSEARICQLHTKAIFKLRGFLANMNEL